MPVEAKVSLLPPKCFLFLAFHKAGLIAQLDLFLKRPQGCGQETHSKSLILPDKKVMKPNNGSQVTPCAHHEVHHLIQLDQNLL